MSIPTEELTFTEISPDLGDMVLDAIKAALYDLHTGLPAKVVNFDPAKQSCDVAPLLKRAIVTDEEKVELISLPIIYHVPIEYPSGAGWSITWPLLAGDLVYLAFAERSLEIWKNSAPGVEVDPKDTRKHALSDAVAKPGIRPRGGAIPGISLTDLRISNDAGTVSIVLGADAVNINAPVVNLNGGGAQASQHMVLGEALISYLSTLVLPVTGTAAGGLALTAVAGPPAVAPPNSLLSTTAQVSP